MQQPIIGMINNRPLTLTAYQEAAISADRSRDDTLNVPLLGLFGETGGLLTVAKKKQRDRASFLVRPSQSFERLRRNPAGRTIVRHVEANQAICVRINNGDASDGGAQVFEGELAR